MESTVWVKCIKYTFLVFNFIFLISGLIIIVAGALFKTEYSSYMAFTGTAVMSAPILLIVVGTVILVVAFVGCCGSISESYGLLIGYAVVMSLIFVLELAAGIAAYTFRDKVRDKIDKNARVTMDYYGNANSDEGRSSTKVWDLMQQKFSCCGVENPKEWSSNKKLGGTDVPDSCCRKQAPECGEGILTVIADNGTATAIFQLGCVQDFTIWVEDNVRLLAGIAVGFAFFQLIGIALACLLARNVTKRSYDSI